MPNKLSDLYSGLDDDLSKYILMKNSRTGQYDVYYEPYNGKLRINDGDGIYFRIVEYLLENNVRIRDDNM